MPRTYLIDAHNALYRLFDPPPESAEGGRRLLVSRALESLRLHGAGPLRAHLVFDTTPTGRVRAGTHGRDGAVSWSYADGSADEEILRIVRENDARDDDRRIVVVTDDRELRGRARQLGAPTLSVREWFSAKDAEEERRSAKAGPPLTAADFGLPDAIDLGTTRPEDL
jgi:rRNA-processing protein FCF1